MHSVLVVHSVLTPLTIPASGLQNAHRIILLFRVGLCIGDARLQRLAVISWDLGVLGGGVSGWQVVTKRPRRLAECDRVVGYHRRSSAERGAA